MGLTASRVSLNHRHECICEKMTVSVAGVRQGWGQTAGHQRAWLGSQVDRGSGQAGPGTDAGGKRAWLRSGRAGSAPVLPPSTPRPALLLCGGLAEDGGREGALSAARRAAGCPPAPPPRLPPFLLPCGRSRPPLSRPPLSRPPRRAPPLSTVPSWCSTSCHSFFLPPGLCPLLRLAIVLRAVFSVFFFLSASLHLCLSVHLSRFSSVSLSL